MNPFVRSRPTSGDAHARAIAGWLDPLTARLRGDEIAWLARRTDLRVDDPEAAAAALVRAGGDCRVARARAEDRADALREHASVTVGVARREVLARHLRETVPAGRRLRGDLAALSRDLDLDALLEREAHEVEVHGARLEVVVRALGGLAPQVRAEAWDTSGALALLCEVSEREARAPTRRAAVAALAGATAGQLARDAAVGARGLRLLRGLVRAREEDPWVRRAALGVAPSLEPELAWHWIAEAAAEEDGREPFLLRARAAEIALGVPGERCLAWVATRLGDPSELVRATIADGLGRRLAEGQEPAGDLLARMLAEDPEPRVRARAADAAARAGQPGLARVDVAVDDVPLVASFALDAIVAAVTAGAALPPSLAAALERRRVAGPPGLARRAARALHAAREARSPARPLARELEALRPGEARTVELPAGVTAEALASALAVSAHDGFGYWLEPLGGRVRVTRGDAGVPTLWRVLHELRNPAPAKRQGHTHAVGRADLGAIRVPPGRLAEESATGVPGERVMGEAEEGWAPAVPLVDDYLHATGRSEVRVVTCEGTTVVRPPRGPLRALRAQARLTFRYAEVDALRTASLREGDPALRDRYVAAMRRDGFETEGPDRDGPSAPWFRLGAALDPVAYLVSMGANSLTHLAVAVLVLLAWLFGRAAWAKARVRRARARIALVVGGWGTRGKSGTERLKAALFEGLGVPFLSKTTGCEAMVLHAPPGGHAVELFLFRPHDKASIWEQVDVLGLADRLDARAMLWECMALNPRYVDILQSGWMRDDLSTLTNAYPDHEDIQGPSGMDVAQVIGGFAPPDALLLCTEENMRPVLAEQARSRNAVLQPLDRVARELVPRDLMDRMPHAEHPANVALAAAAAEALGLPRVEAIGLMAEHVVPDLGALVVYPPAAHDGRRVVFANGMSANDTLSFRHNWRRTGFSAFDHAADPACWLVTVVNNRADRVARTRVFAGILANDANAHRHVLIGTNLRGLARYLEHAIAERADAWVLDGDPGRVDRLFAHLRLVEPGALGAACAARLGASAEPIHAWRVASAAVGGHADLDAARTAASEARGAAAALESACGPDAAGLAEHLLEALARWGVYRAARDARPEVARAAYRALAMASVVVVEDSAASGDRIIGVATAAVPPGAEARIMGVQNIKGTGLDFAYQWVYWREIHDHLRALAAPDGDRRRAALAGLEQCPFESVLACEAALAALEPVRRDPAIGARASALYVVVESRRAALRGARRGERRAPRRGSAVRRWTERLLDPFDAILRRERAKRIFDDLATRRGSHRRARLELKRLTERQKGGWLSAT